jgi:hypothetical protein
MREEEEKPLLQLHFPPRRLDTILMDSTAAQMAKEYKEKACGFHCQLLIREMILGGMWK